jgi:hypothetical protein
MLEDRVGERGREHDLALRRFGLQRTVLAVAVKLAVYVDQPCGEVDVGPGETKRLADPHPGVGEEVNSSR